MSEEKLAASGALTHAGFLEATHFSNLDGIRCFAILSVLWHHSAGADPFSNPIFGRGYLGVDLFFVLSGFLITTLLVREYSVSGSINLKNFYIRRSLRIFPIYYCFLALYSLKTLVFDQPNERSEFFEALPYYLTYLSNWIPEDTANPIHRLWSLAVEEQFYLLWPALLLLVRPRIMVIIASIFIFVVLLIGTSTTDTELFSLSRNLVPFRTIILGSILAIALHHPGFFELTRKLMGNKFAILVPLFFSITFLIFFNGPLRGIPEILVHLAMLAFVLAAVVNEQNVLARALTCYPVVLIGTISYGIYLLHGQFWGIANRILHALPFDQLASSRIAFFVVVLAVSSAAALVSYRFFEIRFLNLKKKYASIS